MPSDGVKSNVSGTNGDNDLRANYSDGDGTNIMGRGGNDILRGGGGNDYLRGGAGNDQMWGGGGADQFRFYGYEIEGTSDSDRIYDLKFGEGDTIVFGNYVAGTFKDSSDVNAFNSGSDAQISSYEGLVAAVQGSGLVGAYRQSLGNDNLILVVDNGNGQQQKIVISGGWDDFVAAGGSTDEIAVAT